MPRPQNQYRKLNRPTKGAHIILTCFSIHLGHFLPIILSRCVEEQHSSGESPQKSGRDAEKTSIVRVFSPSIRMIYRKINFRPCLLPRNEDGYTINPFCPGIFLRNVAGRHKAVQASLQASLAGTALNRWRSFLPSMVLAYQLACGLRIRRTRYHSNSNYRNTYFCS